VRLIQDCVPVSNERMAQTQGSETSAEPAAPLKIGVRVILGMLQDLIAHAGGLPRVLFLGFLFCWLVACYFIVIIPWHGRN